MHRKAIAVVLALILWFVPTLTEGNSGINWRTNYFRLNHDRKALRTNDNLQRLAMLRAKEIVNDWSHQFWWLNQTKCKVGGENIAMRRPALLDSSERAKWFVEAWKDSPTHRETMLGRGWDRQGSAIFISPDGAMWGVQIFCDAG